MEKEVHDAMFDMMQSMGEVRGMHKRDLYTLSEGDRMSLLSDMETKLSTLHHTLTMSAQSSEFDGAMPVALGMLTSISKECYQLEEYLYMRGDGGTYFEDES